MSLFPAYASSSHEEKPPDSSRANASDWLKFSSFQLPVQEYEVEKDNDVQFIDEKRKSDEDDIAIIHEEKRSPSRDRRKRRHKRKNKKEKRKRRRHSSSSSSNESDEDKATTGKSAALPPPRTAQKWSLLKKTDTNFTLGNQTVFMTDNRREIENLRYDTVYKAHLAKFAINMKQCLGNNSIRINRLFFGETGSTRAGKSDRYFSRRNRRTAADETGVVTLKPVGNDQPVSIGPLPEFLPVDNTMVVDGQSFVFDTSLNMYRPAVQSEATASEDVCNLYPGPSSSMDSALVAENKQLNRRLAENPNDMSLWREFIRLQDRLFSTADDKRENEEVKSNLALLERKLSVVEKAIGKNPTSVELKLLRLHIGRDLGWDENRLREEWRHLEFTHINDPHVWIERLQFDRGGEFSKFSVSRHTALYDRCLERFFTVLSGHLITHPAPEHAEEYFISFIMAKIRFLFDSGHSETAVATVQALLEFNFRSPPALNTVAVKEKRQFFEPYWDSNQPRMGENGALGWAETIQKQSTDPVQSAPNASSTDEDEICQRNVGTRDAGLWLELERAREGKHWLPWRYVEEPEDPQRLVLFDDIMGALYKVSDLAMGFELVKGALGLCGMKFPSLSSSNEKSWYDEEASFEALDHFQVLPRLHRPQFIDGDQFLERLCFDVEKLFSSSPVHQVYIMCSWLHHTAVSLVHGDMSSKEKIKRYRRTAKSILDNDRWRDSLICYQAYAAGLKMLGAFKEAADVAEAALNASMRVKNSDCISYSSTLSLICIWMECQLDGVERDWDRTVEKVCNWVSALWGQKLETVSKADILKVRKCICDRWEEWKQGTVKSEEETFLASWIGSIGNLIIHLNVLFNYACTKGNLELVRKFYTEGRQFLRNTRADSSECPNWVDKNVELLWTWELQLIEHHLQFDHSASPRLITQSAEEALREFPANSYFLKLFVDKHLRGQLMTKLRRFFDQRHENWRHMISIDSWPIEISWIAAIYSEFARYVKLKDEQTDDVLASGMVPETNRLRNILTRAVESCQNSVCLWRLRLKLELYLGDRNSVKRTFYLAIRQCPWAKDLYTDGIGLMPEEGQSIVDLMVEKGLRVRVPWEELILLRKAVKQENKMEVS